MTASHVQLPVARCLTTSLLLLLVSATVHCCFCSQLLLLTRVADPLTLFLTKSSGFRSKKHKNYRFRAVWRIAPCLASRTSEAFAPCRVQGHPHPPSSHPPSPHVLPRLATETTEIHLLAYCTLHHAPHARDLMHRSVRSDALPRWRVTGGPRKSHA